MKINLYYWNNGVGVVNDTIIISSLLNKFDIMCYDISKDNVYRNSDLGIHIQNIEISQLENNKKNIFIVNEEWLTDYEISHINKLDYIFTKSSYAKTLLDPYHKNVINTGFFSLDRHYFPNHTNKILHFKGKSIQKNTDLVKNLSIVKILDSSIDYLSDNDVVYNLNNYDIHICCSLYEAWGHYLWEALSCGKLVICSEIPIFKEYLDSNLVKFVPTKTICSYDVNCEFLNTTLYKFRNGYFVDKNNLYNLLGDRKELFEFQKNNCESIRHHFLNVNKRNKEKFLNNIEHLL